MAVKEGGRKRGQKCTKGSVKKKGWEEGREGRREGTDIPLARS